MSQPPTDPTTLDADAEATLHKIADALANGRWVDDFAASFHRLWEEDRRRAQAEFAAIVAEPPRQNRAQRRAARRGRK